VPVIKNAELWFLKLDPKRPSTAFNKVQWEVQIRTKDKEVNKQWREMKLATKLIEDEETGETYYRVNLHKKAKTEDGGAANPVEVVDGRLKPLNPNTVGNGSIGNIVIFQSDYVFEGKPGVRSTPMRIQVTLHKVYVPQKREEFEETDTEVVMPDDDDYEGIDDDNEDDDGDLESAVEEVEQEAEVKKPTKASPKTPAPKTPTPKPSGKKPVF
jgi:hypothetical protein